MTLTKGKFPFDVKDKGFFYTGWNTGTTPSEKSTQLLDALALYDTIHISAGEYAQTDINLSNKTLIMDAGVVFKVQDGTITVGQTDGPPALRVSGSNVTIHGDFTCDGNSANQNTTSFTTATRTGTFDVTGSNFNLFGQVKIVDAFWSGLRLEGSISEIENIYIQRVHVVNPGFYAVFPWSVKNWEIGSVLIEKGGATSTTARVRTGTQGASGLFCRDGKIGTIISDGRVIIEDKTEGLQIDSIKCAGFKTEIANDIQVGSLYVDGSLSEDDNNFSFAILSSFRNKYGRVIVKNHQTSERAVSLSGAYDSHIESILVDGTITNVTDMLLRSAENLTIDSIILINPVGTGIGFSYEFNVAYAPQRNIKIGSIISEGHTGSDVSMALGGEIHIDWINPSAVKAGSRITPYQNYGKLLVGTATYDPPSLDDGAGITTTVSVPNASLGDIAFATFSLNLQGIIVTAWVSSASVVSVRLQNESGGTIDLAEGTLTAVVMKTGLW